MSAYVITFSRLYMIEFLTFKDLFHLKLKFFPLKILKITAAMFVFKFCVHGSGTCTRQLPSQGSNQAGCTAEMHLLQSERNHKESSDKLSFSI